MANKSYASPRLHRRFLLKSNSTKRMDETKHSVDSTTTSNNEDPVLLSPQPLSKQSSLDYTMRSLRRRVSLAALLRTSDSNRRISNSSKTNKTNKSKTVRFPQDESELETVIANLPRMKKKDRSRVYWSRRELSKIKHRATNAAENMTRKNINVLHCIHYCYGLLPDPVMMKLARQQKTDREHLDFVTEWLSSPENAMRYYYTFQVKEAEESSEFFLPEKEQRQRETTVRGLEHQMSFEIGDHRARVIQVVLNAQEDIHRKLSIERSNDTMQQLQASLALVSGRASRKARRFARLLGKADSAIVGTRNGINKPN
mmetsp:Transcript_6805/g.13816  ORF Transcript_6805/g.13816 Transcript_6805/m.13816 type:complete len:314 (-) Transcript_6805:118-1059(-)|eukprot:CAMPEP_0168738774 /NCGR_PEP_ID=MMETSP0724-20121128/11111_1 /TAXON_ID=265536 /ORGANISM="Amphiprora sp., Strain CCMP467" /LENGTH=313 /DNA_ID=CAMNT_0008786137 /DNA_START=32 /DNA_END=973 /DNA_ORIENTATION=-